MEPAFLTASLPGTGGVLKKVPEDFRVDEVPLYLPCGEGEHVFFRVWKRGIATFEAVRRVAKELGVSENHVAYAGLKDARAVTTQWMSVHGVDEGRVRELAAPALAILETKRHRNKLKVGHLRGNRFRIVVRGAEEGSLPRAAAILDVLVRRGSPNYFGEQRFGLRGHGHLCGEAIVRGDYEAFVKRLLGGPPNGERDPALLEARRLFDEGRIEEAWEAMPVRHRTEKKCLHALVRFRDYERAFFAIPKRMRQMFASAFQSDLFNRVLERRLPGIDALREGDLAYLHRNGAVFRVEDAAEAESRCAAFEISPSGPIFGTDVPLAEGDPGVLERAVLAESGLTLDRFEVGGGIRLHGLRRPLRVPLQEASLRPVDATSFEVEFVLPSGAFATSVMREITKAARSP